MADLTNLTNSVNQLKADNQALIDLVTNKVIPDIQTAITLIKGGGGDNQEAIDALQKVVDDADALVKPVTDNLTQADTDLEGAEQPPQ